MSNTINVNYKNGQIIINGQVPYKKLHKNTRRKRINKNKNTRTNSVNKNKNMR